MENQNRHLSASALGIGYIHNHRENFLFENLNLTLSPGQLVCFMGPNGIGKSSLIRTLAGLQQPLTGTVKINGAHPGAHEIAVVLTDKVSAVGLTAYEVVAFGRYPYLDWNVRLSKTDADIIERSVAMVQVGHLMNRSLYELSDGQLQMVMLARALAQDTPIILLDEPTAHLDLNNRVEIMKLLQKLSRTTNKAILVATHELDLALQLADWIWLTGRNKNILTGLPEELVLDGSFDSIFQFKGFDLKTGKVQHEAHKGITITLMGDGYEYLWTKNALERNGYEVSDQPGGDLIRIVKKDGAVEWQWQRKDSQLSTRSLRELINLL
jgi:iron complex transport system ATP-binding protein